MMSSMYQEYANVAEDAYKNVDRDKYITNEENYLVNSVKYKVIDQVYDKESDYHGTIYQNIETHDIFVAHRGTASMEDSIIDYLMATRETNIQIPHALELTERAQKYASKYEDRFGILPKVSVTGHSLGGALAEVCAYEYGLKAVTFNGYGSVGLKYQNSEGEYKSIPQKYEGDITNHMMAGDIVNIANPHIGKNIIYARPKQIKSLRFWNYGKNKPNKTRMWRALIFQMSRHKAHNMSNFLTKGKSISIFEEQRYDPKKVAVDHAKTISEFRNDIVNNKSSVLNRIIHFENKAKGHIENNGAKIPFKVPGYIIGPLMNMIIQKYVNYKVKKHIDKIENTQKIFAKTNIFQEEFSQANKISDQSKQEIGQKKNLQQKFNQAHNTIKQEMMSKSIQQNNEKKASKLSL